MNLLVLLVLLCYIAEIQAKSILLILLGCNIRSILLDRLETSIKFIEQFIQSDANTSHVVSLNSFEVSNPQIKITWFLSGGIKNNLEGAVSEASILKSQIDNNINLKSTNALTKTQFDGIEWNFVMDEKSTNTAENFIWASHFLNTTTQSFDDIYVITSNFHFQRASRMLELIDLSRNFKWILGEIEEKDSRYWEKIHIRNVETDVVKARTKLKALM